jgi:3-hydroxyacyl-CoA dehydrogenase
MRDINRVAVLGSGVMGAAIAGHFANCGIPSLMLDIVPPDLSHEERGDRGKRDRFAETSRQALLKAKPSPIYRKSCLDLIQVGSFDDDMARIADCDLIVEVVKEDLAIKKSVLREVARHRSPGSVVATNTSGILIRSIAEGMDEDMAQHFLGTHFFNPPRYLKLLEIIPGPSTLPEIVDGMACFAEDVLGKGVVRAKDTPNFVGNRILTFACQYILNTFRKHGLTVEDVDALTGPNVGHAKSATFRTLDLVGLDTYIHVIGNVHDGCPGDECRDLFSAPDWARAMLDKGLLGEKSGSGFFQKTSARDEKGRSVILSIDVDTLEYSPQRKTRFDCIGAARSAETVEDKVRAMHTGEDPGSRFVWNVFAHTAIYAGNRIPEIADSILDIDNAVRWGFGWSIGIFETWDALGVHYVCERMKADGLALPQIAEALLESGNDAFYRTRNGKRLFFDLATRTYQKIPQNPNVFHIGDAKAAGAVVSEDASCSLVDVGDGILCAEFHTKMNTIDAGIIAKLQEGVALVNDGAFAGMIVANQGEHFSAGANLFMIIGEIMQDNWEGVENAIDAFQQVNMAIRFCRGPVVSAPHHYAFGGAVEISEHCARVVLAGETYAGLVEAGVGVIPGGGGTKEMLRRALAYVPDSVPEGDPFPYVRRAFETIGMAKVGTSGAEVIELGYLSENDVLCVNIDHQVNRAKDVCLGMVVGGYRPPQPATLVALGEPAKAAFRSGVYQLRLGGYASDHDALVAEHLAHILTGGDRAPGTRMSEQDVLDLEKEAFVALCRTAKTQARIQHMLATGKPLRN